MSRYLNPEALAALPLGSVVMVTFSGRPRIMTKLASDKWSLEGWSNIQVAGMRASLREVTTVTPVEVRTLAGARPDTRGRWAKPRARSGSDNQTAVHSGAID